MDLESQIRRFVAENLLFSGDRFDHRDDASFLDGGIIDSLGVMDLVTFVQVAFGLPVRTEDITRENFDSVSKLAGYIRRQLPAGGETPRA